MKIIQKYLPQSVKNINFREGRTHRQEFAQAGVYAIILHTTDGNQDAVYPWFSNPQAKASTHYMVRLDGTIERYVDEGNTAYANGHPWWNDVTVSIEFADQGNEWDSARTPELYEAGSQLIADICKRWGLYPQLGSTVKGHKDVLVEAYGSSDRSCPAGLDMNRLVVRAQELMKPTDPCSDLQRELVESKTENVTLEAKIATLTEKLAKAVSQIADLQSGDHLSNTQLINLLFKRTWKRR